MFAKKGCSAIYRVCGGCGVVLCVVLGSFLSACGAGDSVGAGAAGTVTEADPATAPTGSQAARVSRGEYLVAVLACEDCHTPLTLTPEGPRPDPALRLAGHPQDLVMPPPPTLPEGPWLWLGAATNTAYSGPWGISYASNLTPDANTGLGIWTEEMFVRALKEGRHMGQSRPILPPMPWPSYSKMTEEDLQAIYAYLRTLPPIANRVPEAVPAEATTPVSPAGD